MRSPTACVRVVRMQCDLVGMFMLLLDMCIFMRRQLSSLILPAHVLEEREFSAGLVSR